MAGYIYRLEMLIEVQDNASCYEAALNHAIKVDGLTKKEADLLLCPDGELEISTCLQMLADPGISWPGTKVLSTSCE